MCKLILHFQWLPLHNSLCSMPAWLDVITLSRGCSPGLLCTSFSLSVVPDMVGIIHDNACYLVCFFFFMKRLFCLFKKKCMSSKQQKNQRNKTCTACKISDLFETPSCKQVWSMWGKCIKNTLMPNTAYTLCQGKGLILYWSSPEAN